MPAPSIDNCEMWLRRDSGRIHLSEPPETC